MVVKVGGMCWVISTGKRSITGPSSVTSDISACGPPVEEPINSTFGAWDENGRVDIAPGNRVCGAGAGAAGRAIADARAAGAAGLVGASGGLATAGFRRRRAPR
jgi:hypothetical protein